MKTFKFANSEIYLHDNDLPADLNIGNKVGIDTETTGLSLFRDRLCLVQVAIAPKVCHMVRFDENPGRIEDISPNLLKLLNNNEIQKIYHYARFDVAMLKKFCGVLTQNNFCTKIASKLVRTYTDKHGLKDLCKELLDIDLNKSQQSSDWSSRNLSDSQIKYAANDVIFLFDIKNKLESMLEREKRQELASEIFKFIPTRVKLDLLDWKEVDIFSH